MHLVMGPTCGRLLADLGADVVEAERVPDGDHTRRLAGSHAGCWPTRNRNTRGLAADVKSREGMKTVRRLLASAGVATENFRPHATDRLGPGFGAVRALEPRITCGSTKGVLPGPYDRRTALDEVVRVLAGART